jgi:hypothetical protein
MSEFLLTGRRIYLFTRPDGRFIVDKPACCRRVFPETEHINRSRTFSKRKTAPASEIAWVKFQEKKAQQEQSSGENAARLCESAQAVVDDIENLLKGLNPPDSGDR